MKNVELLKQYFNSLSFRGKAIFVAASILAIALIWEVVT